MKGEGDEASEDDNEHRVLVNLLSAIVILALALAGFWLLGFLDGKRKLQACLEAGRRDCGQSDRPAAAN